jgi:hypothetical protein
MNNKKQLIIFFAAFKVIWIASVIGAARGVSLAGPVLVALWLVVVLTWQRGRIHEFVFIVLAGLAGFIVDTALVGLSAIEFSKITGHGSVPIWMIGLWVNFAIITRYALTWLHGRFWIGTLIGGPVGLFAYLAGEAMGVLEVHSGITVTVAWAMAIPLVLKGNELSRRSKKNTVTTHDTWVKY